MRKKNKNGSKRIEFTPTELQAIETMSGNGLSLDEMAIQLKVSPKTLDRRIKDTPAISDAILRGKLVGLSMVKKVAFEMAKSGKNFPATKYWLAVKGGPEWQEKNHQLHDIAPGGFLEECLEMPPERLGDLIEKQMRKLGLKP